MRTCCQCKAPDHEIVRPGQDSVHFVVPEIRYLSRGETFKPVNRLKGWTPKTFQGRPAMVRMICVHCLNQNDIRDRVWGQLRSDALKLEKPKNPDGDYYALLVA